MPDQVPYGLPGITRCYPSVSVGWGTSGGTKWPVYLSGFGGPKAVGGRAQWQRLLAAESRWNSGRQRRCHGTSWLPNSKAAVLRSSVSGSVISNRQEDDKTGDSGSGHNHMGSHERDHATPGCVVAPQDSDRDVGNEAEDQHHRHQSPEELLRLICPGSDQLPADSAAEDAEDDETDVCAWLQRRERVADACSVGDGGYGCRAQRPDHHRNHYCQGKCHCGRQVSQVAGRRVGGCWRAGQHGHWVFLGLDG